MHGVERPSLSASARGASNLTSSRRSRRLVEAGSGNATRRAREARLAHHRCGSDDYQLPLAGQAPVLTGAHVRVIVPAFFVIKKL